ncbi:uncharacterized protein EMH_0071590 [Eimeria mitis]|uniref:Adenylate kinase n=1 Tax=Eimeria mitis TaxID=44415 RepID=U6K2R1_9EIME|nr:uncharacterized protein EMH_0071590 [Eimeria mitis]CDJ32010.1 hypothetical protein EMH_0071590 [Eimeria mitis]
MRFCAHEDPACKEALVELEAGVEWSCEELLIQLVAQRIAAADCARRGWVLDGIPQTARQALLLREHKIIPDCILLLEAPEGTLVDRIKKRKADSDSKCSEGAQADKNQQQKDAARLVELRTAQLERWLPQIREVFPGKLTTICADDVVSIESVNQRMLEFIAKTAQLERWLPQIREVFPGKLTTICADDVVSIESVNQRMLEFIAK